MVIARTDAAHKKLVDEFREPRSAENLRRAAARKAKRRERHDRPSRRARSAPPLAHDRAPPRRTRSAHGLASAACGWTDSLWSKRICTRAGPTRFACTFQRWDVRWWATPCTARRGRSVWARSCFRRSNRNFLHAARLAFRASARPAKSSTFARAAAGGTGGISENAGQSGRTRIRMQIDAQLERVPIIAAMKACAFPSVFSLLVFGLASLPASVVRRKLGAPADSFSAVAG